MQRKPTVLSILTVLPQRVAIAFVLWQGQPQEPTEAHNSITNLRQGLPNVP